MGRFALKRSTTIFDRKMMQQFIGSTEDI